MEFDALEAGIEPGGLRSRNEIRILICFLLGNVKKPLTLDILEAINGIGRFSNSFEFLAAIRYLENNDHIIRNDEGEDPGYYALAPKGINMLEELIDNIPLAVREKALSIANEITELAQNKTENEVKLIHSNQGYDVVCTIPGVESELLKIKLNVPDKDTAKKIRNVFTKHPEFIYKAIFALLTGDFESIGGSIELLHPPSSE